MRHDRTATSRRTGARGILVLALVGVVVVAVGLVIAVNRSATDPGSPDLVAAAVPYWNLDPGTEAVHDHLDVVDEISPWTYGIGPGGSVVSTVPPESTASATAAVERLRATGRPLMPSVSNMVGGEWSTGAVVAMLHDPGLADRHVRALTDLAVSQGYDGLDLDYEELRGQDRAAFTAFVTRLADALHAAQKRLSIALFAKTDDAGYDERNVAQDYAALGAAVDEVRLMTYDYHWATSPPGPVAPADWVRDVLDYAVTVIPPQKILLGLTMSGYDWVGNRANPITVEQAASLADDRSEDGVQVDPVSRSPWFRYTADDGTAHEVWFEDADSVATKRAVAAATGVRGVFLWMYGPPDESIWQGLRAPAPAGEGSG